MSEIPIGGIQCFLKNEPVAGRRPGRPRRKASGVSAFPKSVPDCSFPKLAFEDGETGMNGPIKWLLSGRRIARLSVRVRA